jgi:hypothetical protein
MVAAKSGSEAARSRMAAVKLPPRAKNHFAASAFIAASSALTWSALTAWLPEKHEAACAPALDNAAKKSTAHAILFALGKEFMIKSVQSDWHSTLKRNPDQHKHNPRRSKNR